jgi:hypothetical protein
MDSEAEAPKQLLTQPKKPTQHMIYLKSIVAGLVAAFSVVALVLIGIPSRWRKHWRLWLGLPGKSSLV